MLAFFQNLVRSHKVKFFIFLISLPYIILKSYGGGDFRIFLSGANYLRDGISPYGFWMNYDNTVSDVFLYSPFVAFLLIPLTYLPPFIPIFVFCLLNLVILFRIWSIMEEWLELKNISPQQRKWWTILTILFTIRFILHNFEKTQMNIVIFYLALEGMYQILLLRKMRGAILLALGICLKVLPVVFVPYLIYRKKFGVAALTVILSISFLFLPCVLFGLTFNLELLRGWWDAINPTLDKYNAQQNTSVWFHNISALIPVYFSNSSYNGLSVNVMDLNNSQLFWLINFLRGAFVLGTIWFLRVASSGKETKLFLFWELSYIFLILPLIFPHQQKYSYINLVPAFSYLIYYLVHTKLMRPGIKDDKTKILITLLGLVFILTSLTADIIWGMEIGKVFQFLKLITIGTILMIPAIAYFSPGKISTLKQE